MVVGFRRVVADLEIDEPSDGRDRDAEREHDVGEFVDAGRVRAGFDREDQADVEVRSSSESLDIEAHDLTQRRELATDLFVGRTA